MNKTIEIEINGFKTSIKNDDIMFTTKKMPVEKAQAYPVLYDNELKEFKETENVRNA